MRMSVHPWNCLAVGGLQDVGVRRYHLSICSDLLVFRRCRCLQSFLSRLQKSDVRERRTKMFTQAEGTPLAAAPQRIFGRRRASEA